MKHPIFMRGPKIPRRLAIRSFIQSNWESKNFHIILNLLICLVGVVILLQAANLFKKGFFSFPSFLHRTTVVTQEVLQAKDSCSQERPNRKLFCYGKYFASLAYARGPEYAFSVLRELKKDDPDAKRCHIIAHAIGIGVYKRDPAWQEAIRTVSRECNDGALHGILTGYVGETNGEWFAPEILPTICGNDPRASCNHMLGHLILVEMRGNIDKSVKACSALRSAFVGGEKQYDICLSGVFMENALGFFLVEHGVLPESALNVNSRLDAVKRACSSYSDEVIASRCWIEGIYAVVSKSKDPKDLFSYCNQVPYQKTKKLCRHMGVTVLNSSHNYNLNVTSSLCETPQPNDPTFQRDCYVRLVVSNIKELPQEALSVVSFCSTLDKYFHRSCFFSIGRALEEIEEDAEYIKKVCDAVPAEVRNYCLGDGKNKGMSAIEGLLKNEK